MNLSGWLIASSCLMISACSAPSIDNPQCLSCDFIVDSEVFGEGFCVTTEAAEQDSLLEVNCEYYNVPKGQRLCSFTNDVITKNYSMRYFPNGEIALPIKKTDACE